MGYYCARSFHELDDSFSSCPECGSLIVITADEERISDYKFADNMFARGASLEEVKSALLKKNGHSVYEIRKFINRMPGYDVVASGLSWNSAIGFLAKLEPWEGEYYKICKEDS